MGMRKLLAADFEEALSILATLSSEISHDAFVAIAEICVGTEYKRVVLDRRDARTLMSSPAGRRLVDCLSCDLDVDAAGLTDEEIYGEACDE